MLNFSNFTSAKEYLAHFQSSGNIPETKDLLKRSHSETEIRTTHSRIILGEILSSPAALDLHNWFRCKKKQSAINPREA